MRIRIALATAVAVIVLPAVLFALFSIPAASARVTRHEAISQHRAVKIDSKLMSYAQAQKVAKLATYSNAVAAQQEATYLKDVAFMKALQDAAFIKALQQQAAQRAAAAANQAQAAAAARGASAGRSRRTGTGTGTGPGRRRVRRHQHQHAGLGLHPPARVGWQLRRRATAARTSSRYGTWTRVTGLPVARPGLPAVGAGRGRPQALRRARLGALDHPLRLRALRPERRDGPGMPGPRIEDDTEQQLQRAVHNRPHTLRRPARTDDAFPLAVRGANAMAGARLHRAEPGVRRARARRREVPCGSALHSRRQWPSLLLPFQLYSCRLFSSEPAWAQATRHQAVSSHQGADMHHAVRINDKLMSYSQARKVAKLVTYANAVQAAQQARPSSRTWPSSRRSRPRRTPSRPHGWRRPSAKRVVATTRTPGTSASSSGTTSTATRPQAARRCRCSWPGRPQYVGGPPDAPGQCHSY